MQNNVIVAVVVVICLTIGSGGAYAFTSSQVATLANEKLNLQNQINTLQIQVTALSTEKTELQSQVTVLTSKKSALQSQLSILNTEKTSLKSQINTLSATNEELKSSYELLVAAINAMHSSNWAQSVNYNITAGTLKIQSFALDKYGIIWDAVIDFCGDYVSMAHYYWYKGERFFVGSSGISLTSIQDFRPTHGIQEFLYGSIKLDISKDVHSSNRIWISCSIKTQFPEISRDGDAYFDLVS